MSSDLIYTVLLAEDDSMLSAEAVQRAFDEDYTARCNAAGRENLRRFKVLGGRAFSRAGEVLERVLRGAPPTVLLLDDHLGVADREEPQATALKLTHRVWRASQASDALRMPLTVLHTAGINTKPLYAYAFRCAGGHHVIDKFAWPKFSARIDRLWEIVDGARWTPVRQPPEPELNTRDREILAYLGEASIRTNEELAARVGSASAKAVSGSKSDLFGKLFPHAGGQGKRPTAGSDARIVRQAIKGGHVWVPPSLRPMFRGHATAFPLDGSMQLPPREAPVPPTLDRSSTSY